MDHTQAMTNLLMRNPGKPGNKRVGIRSYTLADEDGYIHMSQIHSAKKMKYHEKGSTLSVVMALLTSEELGGEATDTHKGCNYLNKSHKVKKNIHNRRGKH